jgi:DNA repair protein RadD
MDRMAITGDIVDEWLRRAENRPTFVFCVNRRHSQHVAERFADVGVAAEYMDGATPREDRKAVFERFQSGDTQVICNVGVLTTGIDLDVRCIVDAKPTKSRILFVQTIGRGLRTAPGKEKLLILDHAGNHLRLGTVRDIGRTFLDDGKENTAERKRREQSEPRPRLCAACKAVLPLAAKVCPACGEPVRALTTVKVVRGDLIELGARQSGRREVLEWGRRRFYSELLGLAEEREYSQGWAAHQFKQKFSHWPNGYDRVAMEPSVSTRNWVKSRQIAFAKARRAHG